MRREVIGDATLYLANAEDVRAEIDTAAAIVSDPPYGMKWNTDSRRFTGGTYEAEQRGNNRRRVKNDERPFDPAPWLNFPEVILWGSNHYGQNLPRGSTLVWIKRHDSAFGSFLSDAEIGWKKGGHGVYCHRDTSMKAKPEERVHPTQKPDGLMRWCLSKIKSQVICDPYMGSGTTGAAALADGRKFIGIEIDETYFDLACRRIEAVARQCVLRFV